MNLVNLYAFIYVYKFTNTLISGYALVDYLDDDGVVEGISRVTMSLYNGTRQYAANSYLWPAYEMRYEIHVVFCIFTDIFVKERASSFFFPFRCSQSID